MSSTQIIYRLAGSPHVEGCTSFPRFCCWICGSYAESGMLRHKWQGQKFTDQNKIRCTFSNHVCSACIMVMGGRPPDSARMWSHLVDGDSHVRVNKGSKPTILAFLRAEHQAPWFAAVADSGKKHIVPWTPVNLPGAPGVALFEQALVQLPKSKDEWRVVDDVTSMLTAGATKDEVLLGAWTPRAWSQLGAERITDFETAWGQRLRGGAWFDLVVWLAQRDEVAVEKRMAAEKAQRDSKRKGVKK